MSYERNVIGNAAVGVGVSSTPKGLYAISKPGCAATVWEREPLQSFQNWINARDHLELPTARITLRPDMVQRALTERCEACGLPKCNERSMLIDDISALASIFADVMSVSFLRLRLDVDTGDTCHKFHIDAVTARLVCTYRGTGIQYGISTDGAEPRHIFTVPTCSPILLRGTLWPDHPKSGLLHRSPPIEGKGNVRLVLVLDPVSGIESEKLRTFLH